MWSLLVFQFHYIGEFSSGPVLGFSWYWNQICWQGCRIVLGAWQQKICAWQKIAKKSQKMRKIV